jgi:hypothetical protein
LRRPAAGLALLLLALLPAACGKSDLSQGPGPGAGAGSAGPAANPSATKALTGAQARAFVRAVNLTTADVPGLRPTRRPSQAHSRRERLAEAQLSACFDGGAGRSHGPGALAEGSSSTFQGHAGTLTVSVGSNVSVSRSSKHARLVLRALRSSKSRRCVSKYVKALFSQEGKNGLAVSRISIVAGRPPAPGATGGYGWRVTATFAAGAAQAPFTADILGFIDGSADVSLMSTGFPVPFPAAVQERLYTLLLERATSFRG